MWRVENSLGKSHGFWLECVDDCDEFQREKASFRVLRGLQNMTLGHKSVCESYNQHLND